MAKIVGTADADSADGADRRGSDSSINGDLLFRKTTNAILGGFYLVYNELGFGFLDHNTSPNSETIFALLA
jgi:hypothetical protein